jgi:hypothetical protein
MNGSRAAEGWRSRGEGITGLMVRDAGGDKRGELYVRCGTSIGRTSEDENSGSELALRFPTRYGILRCGLNRTMSVRRVDETDVRVHARLSYIPGHVCDYLEKKRLWVGDMRAN